VSSFTVGLTSYLKAIEKEYLESVIKLGISSFKLVIGEYGGGKTHFLYCVRELGWQLRYAVSYVPLSPEECPFDRLELVYKSIVSNLSYPPSSWEELISHQGRGIEFFIRNWVKKGEVKEVTSLESSSFTNAINNAVARLQEEDEVGFSTIIQWLKGEGGNRVELMKYGITEEIERSTAFRMIRSLAQWIRGVGYSGLILLFDEAERGLSIASPKSEKRALDNLRQIVDECGNAKFPGVMIFYAIPDVTQVLEKTGESYEALKQRLSGGFSYLNPSGVRIDLEKIEMEAVEFLGKIGNKLVKLYNIAFNNAIEVEEGSDIAHLIAEASYEEKFASIGYRRLFVKSFIQALHMKRRGGIKFTQKEAKEIVRGSLIEIEKKMREYADQREY
jgi:hypothetical protein